MYAHKDKPESPVDISAVIELSMSYTSNQMPWMDLATPRMWVHEGCNIEQDIIPTMKEIMQKKKGITCYKYFNNPIYAARDKRVVREKYEAEKPAIDCEAYIKIYQWKRDRGMQLTDEQEKILNEYELANQK